MSCRLSGRCTDPASAFPTLLLPAGWLLLSKWIKEKKHREQNESRKEALISALISTVVFLQRAKGKMKKLGSRWNKKESN